MVPIQSFLNCIFEFEKFHIFFECRTVTAYYYFDHTITKVKQRSASSIGTGTALPPWPHHCVYRPYEGVTAVISGIKSL